MQSKIILKNYGLDNNILLTPYGYESEEDWLELRKKGIGGSDVGAIMGINKYSSPLKVYKAKVENIVEDISEKVAVRKGKDLESLIRAVYVTPKMKALGYTVRPLNHLLINSNYPWLRANLDGIAINDENPSDYLKHIVIEIKVVTQYAEDNWYGEDYCGVPASYYAQVQEYMLVTGARKAIICALFEKNWEMHYFEINRDEKFIIELINKSRHFYEYHMLMQVPPRVDFATDKEFILEKIAEQEENPIPEYPDAELTAVAVEVKELKRQIKVLEKEVNEKMSIVIDRYQKGGRSTSPVIKISVKDIKSVRFDSTRFKEEQPGLYEQYSKETSSLRAEVK
jgi:putative phage-type endonuclease